MSTSDIITIEAETTGTDVLDPRSLYVPPTAAQAMRAKRVSPEAVELVVKNRPMPRIPRNIKMSAGDSADITRRMLERIFPHMVQYAPNGVDATDAEFDVHIKQIVKEHRDMGMAAQATEIERIAKSFKGVRHALQSVSSEGLMRPDTVIPIEYLPDLFMAVPVWFRATPAAEMKDIADIEASNDPKVHHSTKYFCDLFPNTAWADTFQMFNRRVRPLQAYKGDMIPPKILARLKTAQQYFDEVVIMTPYHDVASREWGDPAWLRSIDPYVVAFSKGMPFMFVLGRFSDSGVFPLHSELVADTIAFLQKSMPKIASLRPMASPYWHGSANGVMVVEMGQKLSAHTQTLLAKFEEGSLFDWLRGK